jgi:magnesium transporter
VPIDALYITATGDHRELTSAQQKKIGRAIASARRARGFVWIDLVDPDESELRALAAELNLHPLATTDMAEGRQQPKVQSYHEPLFVVMWSLLYANAKSDIGIGEVFLYIGDGFLLTLQRSRDRRRTLPDLRAVLDDDDRPATTLLSTAYAVMAVIVAGYTEVTNAIEDELEVLESQVFDEETEDDAQRIYRLRQKIGKVDRASSTLAISVQTGQEHLKKLTVGDESIEPYLQDLLDDLVGTASLATDQSAALDGVVSTHENNVARQQNSDMRKISALAALLAIPTVTAGLYGMNFKNLPGVNWQFGWLAVVVAVIALDIWAFVAFKRRKWL